MNSSDETSIPNPHWRALVQKALYRHRSDPTARYLQLATVTPTGDPRNRTVVFRGFRGDTDQFQFAVDSRSEKIDQIQHHPQAQVCWYFPKTREQFRVTGSLTLVMDPVAHPDPSIYAADRVQLWRQLSTKGRLLWYWPTPKAPQAAVSDYVEDIPKDSEPPETFVLLLLDPWGVDHLELKGDETYPQLRHLYQRTEQGWSKQAVNP